MMCDPSCASSILRATSNPVSPGICTSRNTTSGCRRSMVVSASTPFTAWPTTSTPPTWPRRYPSSSRASCSSSTRTARKSISGNHAFGQGELRNFDARARALAGDARQLQTIVRPVDRPQAFVDVAQADAAAERGLEPFLAHAQSIVQDFDDRVAVADEGPDRDASAAHFAGQPVLDRVFDQRLQQHARHDDVERFGADLLHHLELGAEPDDLDVQVLVDRLELFTQGDEMV